MEECEFCDMGRAKRGLIWRLTKDMSRKTLAELTKKNKDGEL